MNRSVEATEALMNGAKAQQGKSVVKNIEVVYPPKGIILRSWPPSFKATTPGVDKKSSHVRGILILSGKIIVACCANRKLKVFDQNFTYMSSIDSVHVVFGVTEFEGNQFATCGFDEQIRFWILLDNDIYCKGTTYNVEDNGCYGISYNGSFFCVLQRNAITVLDKQGIQVRKIVMKEAFGKSIEFGFDLHMDSTTHSIYVPCVKPNCGVLCVSLEGEPLWFSPLTGSPFGITDIHGILCVASYSDTALQLISKERGYEGNLKNWSDCMSHPRFICYDDIQQKLYYSFFDSGLFIHNTNTK